MSGAVVCTITNAGLAALKNAQNTGLQAVIAQLAVGQGVAGAGGTFAGYVPTAAQVALKSETARVPILAGSAIADAIGSRLVAQVPASSAPDQYYINEVAAVLDSGVLLAIWSDPSKALAGKTPYADVELNFDLILQGIPASLLTVNVVGSDVPDTLAFLTALLTGVASNATRTFKLNQRLIRFGI